MKVEISIPESLSEITLEQYQKLQALDTNLDEDFYTRKLLSIFCGVTDVLKVRQKDVVRVSQKLAQVLAEPTPLRPFFTIEGTTFGFIPDLENITFGEYVDLDTSLSWPTMHKAMSILFRPVLNKRGDKYTIEKYESTTKYSELFKKMPLSVALGALVFFWTLTKDLSSDILRSSQKEQVAKTNTAQEANSTQGGDGLALCLDLLAKMSQESNQLPDYQRANAFIHLHTSQRNQK